MKLRVIKTYAQHGQVYPAGVLITTLQEEAAALLEEAPECFEIVDEEKPAKSRKAEQE